MNIALVTLDYPPETGGIARYLGNLVRASNGRIHVFVNLTHATNGVGRVEVMHLLGRGPWSWRPAISSIRSLKNAGYTHVLVSHLLPLGTAALFARLIGGIPYSLFIHGLDLRLALAHPRKKKIAKYVLRKAEHIFANSEVIAAEVEAFSGVKPVVVTPGTEEQQSISKAEARKQLGLSEHERVVLAVGRLVPRKGFDTLIASLNTLPTSRRLVIIGDGNDEARLKELAQSFSRRVTFIQHASDEMRDLWYAAADIFALPVRDEGVDVEGFGIVFLEAAAHGLPVIAGRSGGAVEAIEDGKTGLLVDPNNPQDLAEKIEYLFMHKDLREEMGRAGKVRARTDFSWEERYALLRRTLES